MNHSSHVIRTNFLEVPDATLRRFYGYQRFVRKGSVSSKTNSVNNVRTRESPIRDVSVEEVRVLRGEVRREVRGSRERRRRRRRRGGEEDRVLLEW